MRTRLVLPLVILTGLLTSRAIADIPRLITLHGKLADAAGPIVPDGSYTLVFSFHHDSTTIKTEWTETQTVVMVDGLFNVQLGAVNSLGPAPFQEHADLFLGITVQGYPAMVPRIRLTSSVFAYRALDADTADIARRALAADNSINSAWLKGSHLVHLADSTDLVGIGTSAPQQQLHIRAQGAGMPAILLESPQAASGNKVATMRLSENGNFHFGRVTDDFIGFGYPQITVSATTGRVGIHSAAPEVPLDVKMDGTDVGGASG